MIPRPLPDVTLIVIDGGVALNLTKLALADTLEQIAPKELLIFTPEPDNWLGFSLFYTKTVTTSAIKIDPCYSSLDAMKVYWYTADKYVRTPFRLHIEWDGWVLDAKQWTDEFMSYDYIGAPWPWHPPNRQVGNGLGLRSTKLMNFLAQESTRFPLPHPEDHGICHTYRDELESLGFKFASVALARRFSWERGDYPGPTFCFHGAFNWPKLLWPSQLQNRLAHADDYVKSTPGWIETFAKTD